MKRPGGSGNSRKSGFVYKPRSADNLKERAEQTGGRFDSAFKSGFDTYRPKVGDNLIRILPPTWDEHKHYGLDVWVHRYVGAENGTYICLAKMKNKPCPICNSEKESRDAGEADEAKQLSAAKIVVCWIINRDDDNPAPLLYAMSWSMDRDIAALCHNKRTGKVILIDNPDVGYDVTIKRTGQGLKTKYFGIAIDRDPSPITDDVKTQDSILDYIQENPIPSVLQYKDTAFLENMMQGTTEEKDPDIDEDGEQTEEEERPAPRRLARGPGPRRDQEEEVVEEEEEDPPPRSTRRSTRAAPVEEEEVVEEEDEEALPPRRRTQSHRQEPEPEVDEEFDEETGELSPPPKTGKRRAAPVEEEEVVEEEDEEALPPRRPRPTQRPAPRPAQRQARR